MFPLQDTRLCLQVGSCQSCGFNVQCSLNVISAGDPLQLKAATWCDPLILKALEYTKSGWPSSVEELAPYWRRLMEFTVEVGYLLLGKCQKKILEDLHKGHPGICQMKSQARSYICGLSLAMI